MNGFVAETNIAERIFLIRGVQVMLDTDIATLFGVETGQLNRQMKRNLDRFPNDFCFQLTTDELSSILRCQNGISSSWGDQRTSTGTSLNSAGKRALGIDRLKDPDVIRVLIKKGTEHEASRE